MFGRRLFGRSLSSPQGQSAREQAIRDKSAPQSSPNIYRSQPSEVDLPSVNQSKQSSKQARQNTAGFRPRNFVNRSGANGSFNSGRASNGSERRKVSNRGANESNRQSRRSKPSPRRPITPPSPPIPIHRASGYKGSRIRDDRNSSRGVEREWPERESLGDRPRNRQSGTSRPTPLHSYSSRTPREPKRRQKHSRPQRPPVSWSVLAIRGLLLSVVLGVSCGLVARHWGTELAQLPEVTGGSASGVTVSQVEPLEANARDSPVSHLMSRLSAENDVFIGVPRTVSLSRGSLLTSLQADLEALNTTYPQLELGVLVVDIERRDFAQIQADRPYSAASTIKVPVLVALLEAVDRGEVRLDETLVLDPSTIVGEAGTLQTRPPNSEVSVLETATWMIEVSDNTATNLLVHRLGGMEVVNERFRQWGLENTQLRSPLPDLAGTNTTSPADLVRLLEEVERGNILSMRNRDRLFSIMRRPQQNHYLQQGLGAGAAIAHKTGSIGSLLGDVGLVDLPNGRRYLIATLVERGHEDPEAVDLIERVSSKTFDFWTNR